MPEWTCGRCTFINHELMNNCEMCEAPKEAAEIPYFGEQSGTNPQNNNSVNQGGPTEHLPMEQTTPENAFASSFEGQPQQTTQAEDTFASAFDQPADVRPKQRTQPSADNMLNAMETGDNSKSGTTDILSGSSMEANGSLTPKDSLTGAEGDTGPSLPEPMAPVVLHSLQTPSELESPMSEPEQITGAMCLSPDSVTEADERGWTFLDNEVRIVMIGKTGVGKSTTGNNILGSDTFKSSASGASVTKKCQLGWSTRYNRDIQIIDTPGLFDTGMTNEDISREIVKCIGMTSPGPHAFLLVIRLDRFTAEEKATVEHFINIFGQDMLKYLVVLFTRMDDLKYDGTTLDDYLENVPPDLKKLLDACQNRRIGFDNRGSKEEKDQDVQDLLKLIDGMVTNNGGGHYTNEMFEEAERIIAEQEEEHLKKSREKMRQELARMREEVEEELKRKEEEKKKDLEMMRGKLTELGIDQDDEEWVQVFGDDLSPVEDGTEMRSITRTQGASYATPVEPSSVPMESQKASLAMAPEIPASPVKPDVAPPMESRSDHADVSSSSFDTKKLHFTERESVSSTLMTEGPSHQSSPSTCTSSRPAPIYQTDSYTGPQGRQSSQSFMSNEGPREGKSIHQREVEELRERKAKLEAKHMRDKKRMRDDYMAKQSAALHEYNMRHQESRQRYRQEMHNVKSNIFSRVFGAMYKFAKNTTASIGRGFQNMFAGVSGRSAGSHGHVF